MENIFIEIKKERESQDLKWGVQNHPILDVKLINRTPYRMCEEYEIPTESRAKYMLNVSANRGELTYMHILVEEVSEVACSMGNTEKIRNELIQVAAVAVAMIESIDRNKRF